MSGWITVRVGDQVIELDLAVADVLLDLDRVKIPLHVRLGLRKAVHELRHKQGLDRDVERPRKESD